MTADDRKALGPDGVALADALGAREDDAETVEKEGEAWLSAVDLLAWNGSDVRDLPPTPVEAIAESVRGDGGLVERYVLAILDELRQTRAERDAARQELAAARAAIGEAWFLRPDDSLALALSRKTTALERLCADGGGK